MLNATGTSPCFMRSKDTLSRNVRLQRTKMNDRPKNPKSLDELISVPVKFAKTVDSLPFLRFSGWLDEDQSEYMLLFISDYGKQMLSQSPVWGCDGTFATCPAPFSQCFQLLSVMEYLDTVISIMFE